MMKRCRLVHPLPILLLPRLIPGSPHPCRPSYDLGKGAVAFSSDSSNAGGGFRMFEATAGLTMPVAGRVIHARKTPGHKREQRYQPVMGHQ